MKKIYIYLGVLAVFLSSCEKDVISPETKSASTYSYQIPLIWNQIFLDMERYTNGYRPPVAARNLGYISLGAYEAIVHGSGGKYKSFSGHFPGLNIEAPERNLEYNWEVALHAAYEKGFEDFFPTAPAAQHFHLLEVSNNIRTRLQGETSPEVFQRSHEYGKYVAQAIYDWSATDSWGHQGYLKNNDPNYQLIPGEFNWKPTYPDFGQPLLPNWGKVRTFAARAEDVAPPPHEYTANPNSALFREAKEVYDKVNAIKAGGGKEDHWIGEFWSDDCPILTFTPAGRWISVSNQVIARESENMMEATVVYAKIGMALADSGIKCWGEKYKYNLQRPIDYIRKYMNAPNWNTMMCPDGSGAYYTPPFPAFPSGHATFGAAACAILTDTYGDQYRFTDRSHEGRTEFHSKPRSFNSFREMAIENGYSRIPLGVHYQSDSDAGIVLGDIVGARVINLPWRG